MGWTIRPLKQRLHSHLREKNASSHKVRWLRKLARNGWRPRIWLVQEVPLSGWALAEKHWIAYFRSLGCPLTNCTDGGEGMLGYHHTNAAREKLSQAARERWKHPEVRAAYLQYGFQAGVSPTEEHRKSLCLAQKDRWDKLHAENPGEIRRMVNKMRAKVRGRTKPQEHRDKLSAALKGQPKSAETRAKMSVSHEGKTLPEAVRAKVSAAMKGRPKSEEHKAKIRAALLARKCASAQSSVSGPDELGLGGS